jgi:fluoroacetyl-CoA thioesterase
VTSSQPSVSIIIETTEQHTAAAFGNVGVNVVGTAALIGFLETASAECAHPLAGEGDATVGTMINVRHLAPAPANAVIEARAQLLALEGRRLTFAIEARWGDIVIMVGTHERAFVNLERFVARLPKG